MKGARGCGGGQRGRANKVDARPLGKTAII